MKIKNKLRKWIAYLVFKLLKPYIQVSCYSSGYDFCIVFVISIFNYPLHKVKITKERMLNYFSTTGYEPVMRSTSFEI